MTASDPSAQNTYWLVAHRSLYYLVSFIVLIITHGSCKSNPDL